MADLVTVPEEIERLYDALGLADRATLRAGLLGLDGQLIELAKRAAERADQYVHSAGPSEAAARARHMGQHDGLIAAGQQIRRLVAQLRERGS